jgi:GTPase
MRRAIALVGRPNVGKSTLFNALVQNHSPGRRGGNRRIVHRVAGTTRDRTYGSGEWLGVGYSVVDTGGLVVGDAERLFQDRNLSHQNKQVENSEKTRLKSGSHRGKRVKVAQNEAAAQKSRGFARAMRDQTRIALSEAQVVLFVVDGADGVVPQDFHIASELRKTVLGQRASGRRRVLIGPDDGNDDDEFDDAVEAVGGTQEPPLRVIVVANKCDNDTRRERMEKEAVRLGFGRPMCVSAIHGKGMLDVLSVAVESLQDDAGSASEPLLFGGSSESHAESGVVSAPAGYYSDSDDEGGEALATSAIADTVLESSLVPGEAHPERIRVAIVGRPNVGKSSLVNSILEQERVLVSDVPGTTHDPVDCDVDIGGLQLTLIDTAGIRRGAKHEPGLEKLTVLWSLRAIERAHVVVMLIDPEGAVTAQEQAIARHISDNYRSVVLAVNKWDHLMERMEEGPTSGSLMENAKLAQSEFEQHIRERLRFLSYAPVHFLSAKTKFGVPELLQSVAHVFSERGKRFSTKLLMDTVKDAVDLHAPPSKKHNERVKRLKFKFATQSKGFPPSFVFWVNDPTLVHFSYSRYLENSLRSVHPFSGTPLRLSFRKNSGRERSQGLREQTLFKNRPPPHSRGAVGGK